VQIFSFLVFVQILGVFVQILIGWVQNLGVVQKARQSKLINFSCN